MGKIRIKISNFVYVPDSIVAIKSWPLFPLCFSHTAMPQYSDAGANETRPACCRQKYGSVAPAAPI